MVTNTVRVIYIEPNDAEAWPDASRRATEMLEDLQHFFADELIATALDQELSR